MYGADSLAAAEKVAEDNFSDLVQAAREAAVEAKDRGVNYAVKHDGVVYVNVGLLSADAQAIATGVLHQLLLGGTLETLADFTTDIALALLANVEAANEFAVEV